MEDDHLDPDDVRLLEAMLANAEEWPPWEHGKVVHASCGEAAVSAMETVVRTYVHFGLDGPQESHGVYNQGTEIVCAATGMTPTAPARAAMIVHLRRMAPAMLARIRELEAEVATLRERMDGGKIPGEKFLPRRE